MSASWLIKNYLYWIFICIKICDLNFFPHYKQIFAFISDFTLIFFLFLKEGPSNCMKLRSHKTWTDPCSQAETFSMYPLPRQLSFCPNCWETSSSFYFVTSFMLRSSSSLLLPLLSSPIPPFLFPFSFLNFPFLVFTLSLSCWVVFFFVV